MSTTCAYYGTGRLPHEHGPATFVNVYEYEVGPQHDGDIASRLTCDRVCRECVDRLARRYSYKPRYEGIWISQVTWSALQATYRSPVRLYSEQHCAIEVALNGRLG